MTFEQMLAPIIGLLGACLVWVINRWWERKRDRDYRTEAFKADFYNNQFPKIINPPKPEPKVIPELKPRKRALDLD